MAAMNTGDLTEDELNGLLDWDVDDQVGWGDEECDASPESHRERCTGWDLVFGVAPWSVTARVPQAAMTEHNERSPFRAVGRGAARPRRLRSALTERAAR